VLEFVEKNLLELLEEKPNGLDVNFFSTIAWINQTIHLSAMLSNSLLPFNRCATPRY
jgi:hypothetical protein